MKVVSIIVLLSSIFLAGCSQALDSSPKLAPEKSNAELGEKLEAKEEKLSRMKESINSLKAQIKKSNPGSSAMFFRELASRQAEFRILEQDVYYLRQQAKK
ncbi:MAG: hypothetical protein SFY67_11490 [Candidatus Melainabacteria bacterium]|nr:hypothetical protein [Candidatus Melainabacteria bacterium]